MIQHFQCKLANWFSLFLSIAEEKVSACFPDRWRLSGCRGLLVSSSIWVRPQHRRDDELSGDLYTTDRDRQLTLQSGIWNACFNKGWLLPKLSPFSVKPLSCKWDHKFCYELQYLVNEGLLNHMKRHSLFYSSCRVRNQRSDSYPAEECMRRVAVVWSSL